MPRQIPALGANVSRPHPSSRRRSPPWTLTAPDSGVDIEWASDIPFHFSFPFHCLTLLRDEGDLAFEIEIHQRGEVVTVWSKECRKTTTLFSGHCQECDGIHISVWESWRKMPAIRRREQTISSSAMTSFSVCLSTAVRASSIVAHSA
jgi:hypothetical protein